MTPAELMAREIIRLDSRGGRDTDQEPGFDPEAWPSGAAVHVALRVVAAVERAAAPRLASLSRRAA